MKWTHIFEAHRVKIVSNDRRGMIDGHEEIYGKGLRRKGSRETKKISVGW